ncbi:membrane protein insertion efficiency factor YidD [[Clostridium] dakarense]|uniref:membrane protein insertion efficiency factor YidD n=1 Tax=Faecalimicrobium dakarense TaxID=1301100 RepID=UPI002E8E2C28|nr:membrane protein insertion efficiency factor YidD [[Clostridium] dakarense]
MTFILGQLNKYSSKLCIYLVRFYQKFISPLKGPTCRFYPTCSQYSLEAFKKYGFFKGMFLTIKRVSKCHPFHPGGYDPLK